ncbi:MAG: hypothetical protein IIZ69_01930, partial [Pseudomonas sp.]|nr:hypothetical protein [Pseudomonas sp.]
QSIKSPRGGSLRVRGRGCQIVANLLCVIALIYKGKFAVRACGHGQLLAGGQRTRGADALGVVPAGLLHIQRRGDGDDVGGGSSFDLLLKLLSSEINEVKIAALDSINSRISLGFDIGDSGGKIRSAVSTARGSAGVVVSRMLDSLEKKLT